MKYKTILVDAKNCLYRAEYANRALMTDVPGHGQNVAIGGVFGFLKSVLAIFDRSAEKGCAVLVCWEGDEGKGWRREAYPGYKAQRDPTRNDSGAGMSDMQRQEVILRELLSNLGWIQVWSPGFEADDTLATLAHLRAGARGPVAIMTGDRDLHQCVTGRVHVVDKDVWTLDSVKERWGVLPSRIPDVKALSGDTSDNYPGVRGIGEKGARELCAKFATLESLFDLARGVNAGTLDPGLVSKAVAKKLVAGEADAYLFRRLATVEREAPLTFAPRRDDTRKALTALRFASLLQPSMLKMIHAIGGR